MRSVAHPVVFRTRLVSLSNIWMPEAINPHLRNLLGPYERPSYTLTKTDD